MRRMNRCKKSKIFDHFQNLRFCKKGVSPIIAAVVLIAVVVGLGAVVVNIMGNYVSKQKESIDIKSEEMKCSTDVDIDILLSGDEYKICNDAATGQIKATLENGNSIAIAGIQLNIIQADGSVLTTAEGAVQNEEISKGETQQIIADYGSGIASASIDQIKIIPKIKIQGQKELIVCSGSQASITYEDEVSDC